MDQSGAVTEQAKALNSERVTYAGGAVLADAHEERRALIYATPPGKFLDEEHLNDCVTETATWQPDIMRQKMLLKLAGGLARSYILQPHEKAAIVAHWREDRQK